MIKLYTVGTPNGWKVSIALEELGIPYTVYPIRFEKNEQKSEWFVAEVLYYHLIIKILLHHIRFLKINPNGRSMPYFANFIIIQNYINPCLTFFI